MAFGEVFILGPAGVDKFLLFRVEARRAFGIERLEHLEAVFDFHVLGDGNLRVAGVELERIFAERDFARVVAVSSGNRPPLSAARARA